MLNFTEALWAESRGSGLRVLCLSPGTTETEFFDVAGEAAGGGFRLQPPAEVAALALRTPDRRNPPPSVVSGARNHALTTASRFVTRRMTAQIAAGMNN